MQDAESEITFIDGFINESILNQLPGAVFIKAILHNETRYVWANQLFARMLGYEGKNQIIDKLEHKIPLLEPAAESFRQYDMGVLSSGDSAFLNIGNYQGDNGMALLVNKKRLTVSNKDAAFIIALATPINAEIIRRSSLLPLISNNVENKAMNVYRLVKCYKNINLTVRESECFYYVLHGKTAKEIASALLVSRKTVESHIHNIKTKIGVNKRSEFYDFAIANNLLNIIPWTDFCLGK